jgi:hypothetical protein
MHDIAPDSDSWQLALRRPAGAPRWQADLLGPGEPRHFESLAQLIRWLVQLDSPDRARQPGGIR